MTVEPLPFERPLPGEDSMHLDAIRTTWYRMRGLLHLGPDALTFEWCVRRKHESLSFWGVEETDETSPPEFLEVPLAWIGDARMTGGWWRPRLLLRGRRLDAFDGIPGAEAGLIWLPVRRRDRAIGAQMAQAIAAARPPHVLPAPRPLLEERTDP